jgi:hypothetical protein
MKRDIASGVCRSLVILDLISLVRVTVHLTGPAFATDFTHYKRGALLYCVGYRTCGFGSHGPGSIPILSFTASLNRCLQSRYFSVVCTETWPSRN